MRLHAALSLVVLLAGCSSPFSGDGDGKGDREAGSDQSDSTTASATSSEATETTSAAGTATSSDPGSSTSATQEATWSVFLVDDAFEDGNLTIGAGDTIVYTNVGDHEHHVAIHKDGDPADTVRFDEVLLSGESKDAIFSEMGTYHVWCRNHGTTSTGMTSQVTVE